MKSSRSASHIQYRKAVFDDAEGLALVHIQSWQETYKGIVPEIHLKSMNLQERTERWQNGTLSSPEKNKQSPTFIALDKKKIIGFATCGANREPEIPYEGELWAIYLLQHYQNLGIGQHLFHLCKEHLKNQYLRNMYAWVLRTNHTLNWYLKNGAHLLPHTKQIILGGAELEEVAAGWEMI